MTQSEGFHEVEGEKEIAQWIHTVFGGDIVLLTDNNPDGEANPDYLWNGKLWDLKSPRSSKENTISQRIRHGLWQIEKNPGGIILNFTNSKLSFSEAVAIVDKYANKRADEPTVFIIKKGEEFCVLRTK